MSDPRRTALPVFPVSAPETAVTTLPAEPETVYQMVKRAEINPFEVEDSARQSVEVTVQWRLSVLHVAHLHGAQPFVLTATAPALASPSRRVVPGLAASAVAVLAGAALGGGAAGALAAVGALASAASLGAGVAAHQANERVRNDPTRFLVDASMLPGVGEVPVVLHDGEVPRFVFPAGARGEVELDGVKRSVEELVAQGHARPSATVQGGHEVALVPGGRYRVELGGISVSARVVARGRKVAGHTRREPALVAAGVGAAVAVAAMLGTMSLAASDNGGMLSAEDHDTAMADLRAFIRNQSEHLDPPPPAAREAAAAETGQAHAGTAGAMGSRATTAHNHRYELRRTDDHPHVATTQSAHDAVLDRGIFHALGPGALATAGGGILSSPFGEMTTSGEGQRDVLGNMNGPDVGESAGYGGLDTVGTGWGGGGDGRGTVGTGVLGTQGHGNCLPGADCAYGQGHGNHLRDRENHGPHVGAAPPEVSAGISPDVIRRVVLRNLGQVNRCYEQGLATNPTLTGRVAVRFVIAGGGSVLAAAVSQDNLGVPSVSACIADAVHRWSFPVPESSSPITVTYPFNLMPAE